MAESGVISEYVERLVRALEFDPALARRVRREVEDHLWEAVSVQPTVDRHQAERCAVESFGDPGVIAAQFAVASLATRARRIGGGAVVVIGAVFLAMKGRLAWYGVMGYPSDPMRALGEIVVSIDRYAFWLSVLVGVASWLYIGSRRLPGAITPEYREELRRFSLLCLVGSGALAASVLSDGVLTSLRLMRAPWSFDVLMPLGSMAIEVLCAGGLIVAIRHMRASTDRAASGLAQCGWRWWRSG